jgi:hypothetical protein
MADDLRVFARDLFQQAVFVQPQLSLNTSASAGGALSLLGRCVYRRPSLGTGGIRPASRTPDGNPMSLS